jgi:DNA-binding MarR family transcriptional regulator
MSPFTFFIFPAMATDIPLMAELPLWLQLNKVSRRYMDALAARLGHLGIRRHYFLLVAIGEGKGSLNQQQLADLLEVDKVAMVGILDSLAGDGFVRRTRSREDRRKQHIVLTAKARKAIPEIRRTIRELNLLASAGMPPAFRSQFPAVLLAMRNELEKVIRASAEAETPAPSPRKSRIRKAA